MGILQTAIGRGQPQTPTCQQVVVDYKSQRSNPISKYSAQHTPVSHQQNQPHNVDDHSSTTSGPQVHLNLSIPISMCDGCGIDHWIPPCPKNLTMTLATCDQGGIDHLLAQCPRKSPNAQLTIPEKAQSFPSLNAITRLQAQAKPVIEAKDTSDCQEHHR